jgi:bud site selection protein 31
VRDIVSSDLTTPRATLEQTLTISLLTGSRYIYDLYYEKEAISKQLYDWLLKNSYADGNLIAKWKKQGYEKLCCLRCIQTKETNFNSTCICRVPREQLKEDQEVQCVNCGCRGCSSGD